MNLYFTYEFRDSLKSIIYSVLFILLLSDVPVEVADVTSHYYGLPALSDNSCDSC